MKDEDSIAAKLADIERRFNRLMELHNSDLIPVPDEDEDEEWIEEELSHRLIDEAKSMTTKDKDISYFEKKLADFEARFIIDKEKQEILNRLDSIERRAYRLRDRIHAER